MSIRTHCDKCGEPMGKDRLQATPSATKYLVPFRYRYPDGSVDTEPGALTVNVTIIDDSRDHDRPDLCVECFLELAELAIGAAQPKPAKKAAKA